jgi:alcohol dehydrogenase class IV
MRFNAVADDGRLQSLAIACGFADCEGYASHLEVILRTLDISRAFRRSVSSPQKVFHLVDEMFAPGRAENNLRSANQNDLAGILAKALTPIFGDAQLA